MHRVIRGALPRFLGVRGITIPRNRPFLLYRQRHVLFSAGRKENVGLKQWVLETATPFWVKDEETYAPSTRNEYLFYALVYVVGACGVVLSTDGKYPKVAGALRCAPDP